MYLEKFELSDKDFKKALKLLDNFKAKDDEEDVKKLKKTILENVDSLNNLKNNEKKVDK